jgi:hypothetical protein
MKLFIQLVGLCAGVLNIAVAQVDLDASTRFGPKENALSIGADVHRYGLGFDLRYWKQWGEHSEWTLHISLGSLRDPREVNVESAFSAQGGRNYVLYKEQYAYFLSGTWGWQRVVMPLTHYNRFSLRVGLEVGPTFALLKPYYIEYFDSNAPTSANPVVVVPYETSIHDARFVVGKADFFRGVNDTRIVPGFRFGAGITANLAGSTLYVRAIQLGVQADVYTRDVHILGTSDPRYAFISWRLGFLVGNAW